MLTKLFDYGYYIRYNQFYMLLVVEHDRIIIFEHLIHIVHEISHD